MSDDLRLNDLEPAAPAVDHVPTVADTPAAGLQEPPRPLRLMRSAPKLVWLLVIVHGLLLISWSVLTPIYHAPDEPVHVDAAVRLYDGKGWPVPGKAFMSDQGISAWAGSPYSLRSQPLVERPYYLPQSDAVPRSQRPHWNQLAQRYPLKGRHNNQIQQMVQHPPLYYGIQAAVLKVLPGSDGYRWDVWVGIMRIVSALMLTPLPLLAWATCRAVTRSRAAALCAALVPFTIPQLSHIGGTVNSDNAVTLFSGLCIVGCICALKGNRSLRNATYIGVTLALALLSKSPAIVLLPVILASYLIGSRAAVPRRPEKRWAFRGSQTVKPLALAYGLGLVLGGWWYIFQKIRTGSFQPSVPDFPGGITLTGRFDFVEKVWHYMPVRFWGSAGWYEVSLPFSTALVATIVVFLLTSYGLLRAPGWRGRAAVGLLLFPVLAAYGLVVLQAYSNWKAHGRLLGIQGRYLFCGIVALSAAVGLGVRGLPARVRSWTPLAFVAAACFMQWQLISRVINVWWRPPHGTLRQAWGALSSFAVWSPGVVRVLFSLTALALLAAVIAVTTSCVRRDRPSARPLAV